jgi:hypothetical protein
VDLGTTAWTHHGPRVHWLACRQLLLEKLVICMGASCGIRTGRLLPPCSPCIDAHLAACWGAAPDPWAPSSSSSRSTRSTLLPRSSPLDAASPRVPHLGQRPPLLALHGRLPGRPLSQHSPLPCPRRQPCSSPAAPGGQPCLLLCEEAATGAKWLEGGVRKQSRWVTEAAGTPISLSQRLHQPREDLLHLHLPSANPP